MSTPEIKERKKIVVCGAGPAGLLLTSLLLDKNKASNRRVMYDVILIEGRQDYGLLTKEQLSSSHRSWMIGLADHGIDAMKTLPKLYDNYIKSEGMKLDGINVYVGKRKIEQNTVSIHGSSKGKNIDTSDDSNVLLVDRNFIVSAISKYIRETHENDPHYKPMFLTKCQYVDYERKRILVHDSESGNNERYIDYDLLIGCDGVRSIVRNALVKRHSNFTCEITDTFAEIKALHLKKPKTVNASKLILLPNMLPNCGGVSLSETDGMINMGITVIRSNFDKLPRELKSDDYKVVSKYVKENFKAFVLDDYDDFAKQWVNQRWSQTGLVYCNFYHSTKMGIVIMGDAAHATNPSTGMGMNTALRDAQIFSELLTETDDDFTETLTSFSKARVKEGNALTSISMHLYCMDKTEKIKDMIHQVVRGFLHSKFPKLVDKYPIVLLGQRGISLTDVYERVIQMGLLQKNMYFNNKIKREYFEDVSGMVRGRKSSVTSTLFRIIGFVSALAFVYQMLSVFY